MKITKQAGKKIKMIVLCDDEGIMGRFADGQGLGKKCEGYINQILPGAGSVGHDHQDWAQSGPDTEPEINEDVRKQRGTQENR